MSDFTQKPKIKSKFEILSDFKKMIEKNGYDLDDDNLRKLYDIITKKPEDIRSYSLEANFDESKRVQEIKVFPKKSVYIEKYKEKIEFNDKLFDDIINNFNNQKLFRPYIDKEHELGIKYADIIELFKKEDGLYAKVDLNDLGYQAIKNREYSYISPEWGSRHDTDGKLHKNVLWAITLTNVPALEGDLPPLQQQMKLSKEKNMELKDFRNRLEVLEAKIRGNKKLQEGQEGMIPVEALAEVMELLTQSVEKIKELTGANQEQGEQIEEMQGTLESIKKEALEKEKDELFGKALESGQVHSSEVELLKTHFDKNAEFVRTLLSKRPVNPVNNQQAIVSNGDQIKLSLEDRKMFESEGYDLNNPEDLKKAYEIAEVK